MSVVRAAGTILKHWRTVLASTLVVTLLVTTVYHLRPRRYTAAATFFTDNGLRGGVETAFSGLAGEFGFQLGGQGRSSPQFYSDLARSREVLERLLRSRFPDYQSPIETDSSTLLILLGVGGRQFIDSIANGVRVLKKRISASADVQTSVVTLRVRAPHPVLAADVANRLVEYLNELNAETLQSQARVKRRFVETRLGEEEQQLRQSEERLRTFYERNRNWANAPQLAFEEGRLRRQVDIHQDLYLTLRREYERARIDEVNDTPLLTTIDAASPPQRRAGLRPGTVAALAAFGGLILGIVVAFGLDDLARRKSNKDSEYAELEQAIKGVRQELQGILQPRRTRQVG